MEKRNKYFELFLTFFKISLFTFGGGYAMISFIEREFVQRLKWISHEEFMEVIAIAESTPGPIAINSATYIGYKKGRALGSAVATLGVVLPSFVIIYIISLFFDEFLALEYVGYAFRGIQVCVAYLIINAGVKMIKKMDKRPFYVTLFIIAVAALEVVALFSFGVSSILFILAGAVCGLVAYAVEVSRKKLKEEK